MKTKIERTVRMAVAAAAACALCVVAGCASSGGAEGHFRGAGDDTNVYVSPGHSSIRKVAVLPFKAPTELIGTAVSDQILTELLRTGRYEMVERSQMAQVLGEQELSMAGVSAGKAAEIGAMLGADGVIIGTVSEYEKVAHRGSTIPVVGISARMIDTQSGRIVWSSDVAERARNSSATLSEHSRKVVHELIAGVFFKMQSVR